MAVRNIITASINFDFKGKQFSPSLTIDLDIHLQSTGKLPDFYGLIAAENDIDLYSYEYEMMLTEDIKIHHAEGLVADFIVNNTLDTDAFERAWEEQHILDDIQKIVERNMGLSDLQQHPELKQTLVEIYQLGTQNPLTSQ